MKVWCWEVKYGNIIHNKAQKIVDAFKSLRHA